MTLFNAAGLREAGFVVPIPFRDIERTDVLSYRGASDVQGVYVVLHEPAPQPDFLAPDHPKHQKVTATACLAERWVPEASVLYIGKAPLRAPNKRGKRAGLWQRIKEYRGFVYRSRTNHQGGEDLRRLPDRDSFMVTWKDVPNPSGTERDLILEFSGVYGRRPFGNRDDGDGPLVGEKSC